MPRLSGLVRSFKAESAFTVLALARTWKARGKDVVELEIGDSPFPSTPHAKAAGIRAIEENKTGYGPSLGLTEFREAAAKQVRDEFGIPAGVENVVVASGAKPFEQYFAEALLEPGDGVLVFSPHFPTYPPNIERRGARMVLSPLSAERQFRPSADVVARFVAEDPQPRALILNTPQNPTGGVATAEDLDAIADVVRGTDIQIFSDEPYCHMVWLGKHESILARAGMFENAFAAYTFSKSYSMSGWRIGFGVGHPDVVEAVGKLVNSSASCSPPFVQLAAKAAIEHDGPTRDEYMSRFRKKVESLTEGLSKIEGISVAAPVATFYVFPDVRKLCNRLGVTSHGLALFLLEAADDAFGVACLGGECFGQAGAGFLRLSCAEPDDRIEKSVAFMAEAFQRTDRLNMYLDANPQHRLTHRYPLD